MLRQYRCSVVAWVALALLLVGVLASCRLEEEGTPIPVGGTPVPAKGTPIPVETTYPRPQVVQQPTRSPRTAVPTKAPAPSNPTLGTVPTAGPAAFTVTVLLSGEVAGEVRKCG